MARGTTLLLASTLGIHAANALFSIHDDILAFPQFEVSIGKSYISQAEAARLLASASGSDSTSKSTTTTTTTSTSTSTSSTSSSSGNSKPPPFNNEHSKPTPPTLTYQQLHLNTKPYLCSIPIVVPPPAMNATEKEVYRAQEEKELARATTRGWELLGELEGKCLYFISGWWSYSFCHNREVRQFHQLPQSAEAGGGAGGGGGGAGGGGAAGGAGVLYPPEEDPAAGSYVLGKASGVAKKAGGKAAAGAGGGAAGVGAGGGVGVGEGMMELQGSGDSRYLVQKLGGGTVCDLTKKERRIEVQYHCNPSSTDRIGFVKEVSICCYLMVVYTPRLCNDVAFLPPRDGRANMIECKEILDAKGIREWDARKLKEGKADRMAIGGGGGGEGGAAGKPAAAKTKAPPGKKTVKAGAGAGGKAPPPQTGQKAGGAQKGKQPPHPPAAAHNEL
ncbi:hypothetical protein DFH27DRAFT_650682 [Peziza echinospora]|nr:hypothetical protein DFH27DRAFT_650682 [Peziza echinospora]